MLSSKKRAYLAKNMSRLPIRSSLRLMHFESSIGLGYFSIPRLRSIRCYSSDHRLGQNTIFQIQEYRFCSSVFRSYICVNKVENQAPNQIPLSCRVILLATTKTIFSVAKFFFSPSKHFWAEIRNSWLAGWPTSERTSFAVPQISCFFKIHAAPCCLPKKSFQPALVFEMSIFKGSLTF